MFDEQPDGDPHSECAAEIHRLQAELNAIWSVLPGTAYMDPPDGGAPTLLEQLQRQAKDAARYRWLRDRLLGADFDWNESGKSVLVFEWPSNVGVYGDCDMSIDGALPAAPGGEDHQ